MNIDHAIQNDFQFMTESLHLLKSFWVVIKQFYFGVKSENQLTQLNICHNSFSVPNVTSKEQVLYLEISAEKINTLLAQRIICATDVRCLDDNSKHCLKALCLETCLHKKQSYQLDSQRLVNSNLAD